MSAADATREPDLPAWAVWAERARAALASDALSWAVVAGGVMLRVAQYAFNRSLWVDESYLALNIIGRSFRGLAAPLFHNQAAPIGFLWLEKLAVLVFGTSEPALRLVPLVAGIASLVLFRAVAKRVLRPEMVAVALALFAVSDRLVYYASEVKQYSTDVLAALALTLVALDAGAAERLSWRRVAALAAAGAVAVWFAHPAVFVLAGVGVSLGVAALARREWARAGMLAVAGAVWAASFALAYAVSLDEIASNAKHQRYWGNAFMPMPPFGAEGLSWLKATFLAVFQNPAGFTPAWLALACFGAGAVYLAVTRRLECAILLAPTLVCLVASGMRLYPFSNRLLLFLVPVFALAIAAGVEALSRVRTPVGPALAAALAAAVLFQPSLAAARALRHPRTHEELKPVLAHVRDHKQPGDVVYLYYAAQYPMQYYGPRYGLAEGDYVLGRIARRDPERYRRQLDALRGNSRVWVVFSHTTEKKGIDEARYFLDYLDQIGTRLDEITATDASAYLYDLSQ